MANVTNKSKNDYNTQTPVSQRKGDLQRSIREKDPMSGIKAMPGGAVSGSFKYGQPIGPMNRGYVPGGRGIVPLRTVLKAPTQNAPKATVNAKTAKKVAPTSAPVKQATSKAKAGKPTEITIPGGGLKTAKTSATAKSKGGLGVTTGKQTGSSATRAGTGGRTTNGGRAAGGGYSNAGPAGMGASGRGTGGKR